MSAGRSYSVHHVPLSAVEPLVSSLKVCHSYITTGMDIATNVALDLTETGGDIEDVNVMEKVMLEYSAMDRELSQFMTAVEETVHQVAQERPEKMPDLQTLVKDRFNFMQSKNTDSELHNNERVIQFKQQLKEMRKQAGLQVQNGSDEVVDEELDEDVAVTQSQTNFICPITQVEMKNPVKNKVCGHIYEEEAIRKIIQRRQQQKKRVCCPTVGCDYSDMSLSDLVPDVALKKAIESRNKQREKK
ncbi:E3 SUMO-protein ligase NSE2 [Protopterus annectens]|uniref:E3 SUMO-protein ligase NSE2 n=1 Tax=Protopterus annectens TaxID=7888 RepID=UPI001CFB3B50|nr:E3 SUMO-protein ligase NSE2 [Protopterus annectens]